VLQTLHTLKDLLPETHVILMSLLPRGGGGPWGTPRFYAQPSVYSQAFDITNAHFRWGFGGAG